MFSLQTTHSASQRFAIVRICGKSQLFGLPSSVKYFSRVSFASAKATSLIRRDLRSPRS